MIARLVAGLVGLALCVALVPEQLVAQPYPGPMAGPPVGSYMRFRLVRVFDEHGFEQPVEAYRLLVPADWQAQTWVRWRPEIVHCPSNPIDAGARLMAPDGITGLEIFSPAVWRWVDDAQSRQISQRGRGCPRHGQRL